MELTARRARSCLMRFLVTGGYGLIGSAVIARLARDNHQIRALGRDMRVAAVRRPDIEWYQSDFGRMTRAQDWRELLDGIDAVVNCVGILDSGAGDDVRQVHVTATVALFEACQAAGIRRVVHFSAIGVDREQPSAFSKTKLEADKALAALDLDWIILRPSVVLGRSAYGASALLRGVAALPGFLPVMPDTAPLQVVTLDDVTATVAYFLRPDAPSRLTLELAGPERLTFTEVALAYRRWLGFSKPRLIDVPPAIARLFYLAGDFAAALGWRPPVRSAAAREMQRGAVGDPRQWTKITGIEPASLSTALAAEPASVQETWFARLYFFKPLSIVVLSWFWIMTGLLALGPGYGYGEALMEEGGVGPALGTLAIVGGGLLDFLIGVGIALRKTSRAALWLSIGVAVLYAIVGTVLVPRLWADPLGPMLKIWPVIVLTMMALAMRLDR